MSIGKLMLVLERRSFTAGWAALQHEPMRIIFFHVMSALSQLHGGAQRQRETLVPKRELSPLYWVSPVAAGDEGSCRRW